LNRMNSANSRPPRVAHRAGTPLLGEIAPKGRVVAAAMAVVTALLILSPLSKLLLYVFPLMAVFGAAYFYRRNLPGYVSLVCWLWFLSPGVRRLVDYRAAWIPATAVLLAPPLALCVPAIWLIADWRKLLRPPIAPLFCILATCFYATGLGLVNYAPRLVFQDLLTWLAPLVFALTLYRHREQAVEMFAAFEKAFLYGAIVVSIYGLVQFFLMPAWDVLWIEQLNTTLNTVGNPVATEVRVFSTMNAPQVLASFLAVSLLIAFNSRRKIRFISIPLSLLCLMLSLARSGWVAMAVGTIYLLFTLPRRQQLQMLMAGLLAVLLLIGAMQNPDLHQVISDRFQSLTDVRDDVSFNDRITGYKNVFEGFLTHPFGWGMGVTPTISEDATGESSFVHGDQSFSLQDSTIAMVLVTLGLAGGLVLFGALFPLGRRLFRTPSIHPTYTRTIRAILVALLAESVLNNVFSGPPGFLTWSSVGFCIILGAVDDQSQPAIAALSLPSEYATVAL
jgi:O-Antigen ligase